MRPKLVAALLAEGVSLDAFTNRFTAYNMMELVSVPRVPAMLLRMGVFTAYELGDEPVVKLERVTVTDPAGTQVITPSTTTLTMASRTDSGQTVHRSLHMLWGLNLKSFGEYRVSIEHGDTENGPWEELSRRSLLVIEGVAPLAPPPATAATQPG